MQIQGSPKPGGAAPSAYAWAEALEDRAKCAN
jgi:hypothetical protein